MATQIDARVKQKTGTAADFAGFVLLEGEISLVRSTSNGPVINYKVGPGLFDSLPWSLQVPGTVASVSPSTDFGSLPAGLYLPDSDGTYDGTVAVDLTEGVTYLNWDGSTLTKQLYPINLSGYISKSEMSAKGLLYDAVIENGSVSSGGAYLATSGAKRVRFLQLTPGNYVLDGVEENSIKFFSLRNSSDSNVGVTQNLGAIPFEFTIPPTGISGVSFTIKAPTEPNDDSITNASLLPKEFDGGGVTLTYQGKNVISSALTEGNYVPEPTVPKSATSRDWVESNAMTYPQPKSLNQSDVAATITPDWTWGVDGGAVKVTSVSGIWDCILFSGVTNGLSFTVRHQRLWIVVGYSSVTEICCVGVAGGGGTNLFGQVVNVDLSADTFTVIRTGVVPSMSTGQSGHIEIQGGYIRMYKAGVLSENVSLDSLTGAYLGNINFGIAGSNFSNSIANGAMLASSVSKITGVAISAKLGQLPITTGLKGFVLGDSISTASYGGLVNGQIWWQIASDQLGATFGSNAVSGTPIAEKSGFNSFVTDARWQAADLDTDIYVIEGGINDFGAREIPLGVMGSTNKTDFYGALRYLFTGIAARYPRAKIFYMTPLHTHNYGFPATNSNTGNTLQQYVVAAREMCDMVGVTIIDMYQRSGITYQNMNPADGIYTTDGLHPNAAGHAIMSNVVKREIEQHF